VAHAISISTLRFDHMSPTAAGMAATLHLLVALALFWATPNRSYEVPERTIEVTMEEPPAPKAETPPPPQPPPTPPAVQAQPAPPPPAAPPQPTARLGAPPVQAKPKPTEQTSVPLGVTPPSERTTEPPQQAAAQPPPPPKQEPQPDPPQQAAAEPPPKPEPQPEPQPEPTPEPQPQPAETKLPPVDIPAAPLSMQDFVRAAPPPPPQEIVRPQPRVQPTPPTAAPAPPTVQQTPPPQYAPSPLGHSPQQQPRAPANSQASASMVNPADAAARARVADEYVWTVIRKFSQYLPDLRDKNDGGTVVVRMMIARDGRLLESGIVKPSGIAALDRGMLEALRAAAPYPPLPTELPGDHIVFTQPITAKR
jgi:TonB family protein